MDSCKGMDTPLPHSINRESPTSSLDATSFPYAHILGSIRYLASCTRPDICFTANFLSCFMKNLAHHHIQYLKRLLRYLKTTTEFSLTYRRESMPIGLLGYSDAHWGVIQVHVNLHQVMFSSLQMLLSLGKVRNNHVSHYLL
ncbi:hypothetical protein KP509_17G017500 [Ceratopteris richardii]|uniref:Mitochondrial protein n=1 Tax=Ceratopteris richardii TaxID=49495 RepID=A0A8T2SUU1_CERRI|nr:hypothetical protein KP509_17G017500 [Ceratopteris richardii]